MSDLSGSLMSPASPPEYVTCSPACQLSLLALSLTLTHHVFHETAVRYAHVCWFLTSCLSPSKWRRWVGDLSPLGSCWYNGFCL
uniref:Uncharacterized protein n=1 Tax=Arundo donax TaxID=35708 RepID=A0A0A9GX02_ARUDO